jgi:hypothetical protein
VRVKLSTRVVQNKGGYVPKVSAITRESSRYLFEREMDEDDIVKFEALLAYWQMSEYAISSVLRYHVIQHLLYESKRWWQAIKGGDHVDNGKKPSTIASRTRYRQNKNQTIRDTPGVTKVNYGTARIFKTLDYLEPIELQAWLF